MNKTEESIYLTGGNKECHNQGVWINCVYTQLRCVSYIFRYKMQPESHNSPCKRTQ